MRSQGITRDYRPVSARKTGSMLDIIPMSNIVNTEYYNTSKMDFNSFLRFSKAFARFFKYCSVVLPLFARSEIDLNEHTGIFALMAV